MSPKYFIAYMTANDTPYFHIDYFNLINMFLHDPGVKQVHLYIAVSQVQEFTHLQKRILSAILQAADNCEWLTCEEVILKSNIGRDFSSLQQCLLAMSSTACDDDFILVRNRSSRGPYMSQWYKKYVDLMTAKENIAIVGSTIGLIDHLSRGRTKDVPHVQTYAYLSQWKYFSYLLPDFPGRNAVNKDDAIMDGEIELSQRILKTGAKITSLQKPDMIIDIHNQNDPVLSTYLPHLSFSEIPMFHRKREVRDLGFWIRRTAYLSIFWRLVKKNNVLFIDKTTS
ncbi:MAG TPA: hypothetical protein VMZ69_09415 [Saprospiraceae bacterium]|nr:hypothetical protein [Saprospiraceae bacterium]